MCFYTLETLVKFVMPSIIELNPTEIITAKPAAGEVICNFSKTFVIYNLLNSLWICTTKIFHGCSSYMEVSAACYTCSPPRVLHVSIFNVLTMKSKQIIPTWGPGHKHHLWHPLFSKRFLRPLLPLLPCSRPLSTRCRKNKETPGFSLRNSSSITAFSRRKKHTFVCVMKHPWSGTGFFLHCILQADIHVCEVWAVLLSPYVGWELGHHVHGVLTWNKISSVSQWTFLTQGWTNTFITLFSQLRARRSKIVVCNYTTTRNCSSHGLIQTISMA